MQTVEYKITDSLGIHARPAGLLVKQAATYESTVKIKNTVNGKEADAKRIMGVMSLGVKQGNDIVLTIEGADEEKAKQELETFLKANL